MNTATTNGQIKAYTALLPFGTQVHVSRRDELRRIYDAHVNQIYKFVFYKVGSREDAEDITSQVFIKATSSLDVTQEEPARLAWLYQVARTTITDHWRGFYKSPTASLEQLEECAPLHLAAADLRPGSTEEEEPSAARTRVSAILGILPLNYRRVLELRFLQGCSLKETAQAMGITTGNAKVLQYRALHKAVSVAAKIM